MMFCIAKSCSISYNSLWAFAKKTTRIVPRMIWLPIYPGVIKDHNYIAFLPEDMRNVNQIV